MKKGFAIAIDGPVASGKGTLAPNLAKNLKGFYLDTGAMYRCVTLFALNNDINLMDSEEIVKIAKKIEINFSDGKTFLDKKDVSLEIRTNEVSKWAPIVAGVKGVRKELISKQKEIAMKNSAEGKAVVVEGRDIATIVLPEAEFKLYLTANPKSRASRRKAQLSDQGEEVSFEDVLNDVNRRDNEDIEVNKTLVKDPKKFGYIELDNSYLNENQTLDSVVQMIKEKGLI